MMTPQRRYAATMKLAGGFTALTWNETPLVWDRDCHEDVNGNDTLYWLDESTFGIYQLADWDWDDTDGNILHRRQDEAAYDALLYWFAELGCLDPANSCVVRDLAN